MSEGLILHMMSELFWAGLRVAFPVLIITMVVGVLVNVLQVVTQIHEASLSFVPKLFAAGVTMLVFGSWMLRQLVQFAGRLWADIPSMF